MTGRNRQVALKPALETFVFSGRTTHLRTPLTVHWELTFRCNMRCIFCYDESGEVPASNELSTEEAKGIIDQCSDADVYQMTFGGGEPFLRKDLLDILAHVKEKKMWVYLITNATRITPEVAGELAEILDPMFDKVQVSIDGSCAEVHERQRGVKGSFRRTLDGIKALLDTGGISVLTNTVVTKLNLEDIPNIIEFCKELKVSGSRFLKVHPLGRGREIFDEIGLSNEESLKLNRYVWKMHKDLAGKFHIADSGVTAFPMNLPESRSKVQKDFTKDPLSYACAAGTSTLAIGPEGQVVPCSYFYAHPGYVMGNLREESLMDIWNDLERWKDFRERLDVTGKCRECGYLHLCKGGCRALSLEVFDDVRAPDPSCFYEPRDGKAPVANLTVDKVKEEVE